MDFNYQHVQMVSYTKFTMLNENLTEQIAYIARVSNPANQLNMDTADKLIKYLIRNKHWSPFEMVNVCMEINTTRDISRQILRHRSFSFQEFSQRYAVADLGFVNRECRLQDLKNRQSSLESSNNELDSWWIEQQHKISNDIENVYKNAIEKGIAKEQARSILPEGNTLTRLYMNGTIRSWIHFIELRSGNGTQKEHRDIAIKCANEIAKVFPEIMQFVSQS